jgi:hypothetical protein
MRPTSTGVQLSASDLSQFLGCRHRTARDLAAVSGQSKAPEWIDPVLQILRERGIDHERGYVEGLLAEGLTYRDLSEYDGSAAIERTLTAVREGVQVIVQGALGQARWYGRPDVLRRV